MCNTYLTHELYGHMTFCNFFWHSVIRSSFDGANYLMDYLKTRAPFWKKEHLKDGTSGTWVDAKDDDDDALSKWDE